jgi:hypothetical protein
MKSPLGRSITFIVALGSFMFACSAVAQSNTYLYIAHAAPGRTLSSTTSPDLPVDISIDGKCIVQGETFGEIRGPFSGTGGTFDFKVSTANTAAPCSNPAIFTATGTFAADTSYLGILTFDASNSIIGQIYPINLAPVAAGQGHLLIANATQQNLSAEIYLSPSGATASGLVVPASTIAPGVAPAGLYTAKVFLQGPNTWETGPVNVQIESRNLYLYVLAGSATNNSVQVVGPKVIRDVY